VRRRAGGLWMPKRCSAFCFLFSLVAAGALRLHAAGAAQHLLYVAVPGIRDYVEYGGVGILVYDIDHGHRLLKRIPTPLAKPGEKAEAVKGICASAKTGRVYLSTPTQLACFDLNSEKLLWQKPFELGCDRMAITPDGKTIFLPSFEGPIWNVVDALTGDLRTRIETKSGSHNTICGPGGTRAYLAGLKSPNLYVADTGSHQ